MNLSKLTLPISFKVFNLFLFMDRIMFRLSEYNKVFKSIVIWNPINMMDKFPLSKTSAKMLRHNNSVFTNPCGGYYVNR